MIKVIYLLKRNFAGECTESFSSCYFLTCDVTLTAVHMAQCICHHHLILVGGGKNVSDNETLSQHGCVALLFSCREEADSDDNARHTQSGARKTNTVTDSEILLHYHIFNLLLSPICDQVEFVRNV